MSEHNKSFGNKNMQCGRDHHEKLIESDVPRMRCQNTCHTDATMLCESHGRVMHMSIKCNLTQHMSNFTSHGMVLFGADINTFAHARTSQNLR